MIENKDKLKIDGKFFESRLIMGTSQFPNLDVLNKSIEKSESEIVIHPFKTWFKPKRFFF